MQRTEGTKKHLIRKAAFSAVLLACSFFFVWNTFSFADQEEYVTDTYIVLEEDSEAVQSEIEMDIDDEELFAGYVNEVMFEQLGDSDIIVQSELALGEKSDSADGEDGLALYGQQSDAAQISSLNPLQKAIYEAICSISEKIASGEVKDSAFIISFENAGVTAENTVYVQAPQVEYTLSELDVESAETARDKLKNEYIIFADIYNAVLYNNPYLFYWHDKVTGASSSLVVRKTQNGISLKEMKINFSVSEDYSNGYKDEKGRLVQTEQTKTAAVTQAVEEAKRVVSQNAQKSDYYKLCAYRDYICKEVSYNYGITSSSAYGNPWQIIYVFDRDPSTEVVCEGYAKAFKYLCDLSSFEGDIKCSLIGGYMSSGGNPAAHMWNALTMENGRSYLVDITNSDAGDKWAGKLFLNGYIGSGEDNRAPSTCMKRYYQYSGRYSAIKYYAFTKMNKLYEGTSVMLLSDTDYETSHNHNCVDGYCAQCDSYQFVTETKLAGCALSVGDKACMEVYISKNGAWSNTDNNFIRFTFPNGVRSEMKVSNATKKTQNNTEYLVFTCEFEAYQMADEVVVTFHDAGGTGYVTTSENGDTKKVEYKISVRDYADRLMDTDCESGVKDCMQTVLLYGGAVQKCANYNVDRLAGAGYSVSLAHIKKLSDKDIKSFANKNPAIVQYYEKGVHKIEYKKIDMSWNDSGVMRVYISPAGGISVEDYNYYVDGNITAIEQDSFGYYVSVTGLKPANYSKSRVVTVKNRTTGKKELEITVSAYNWVRMALGGETSANSAVKEAGRYIYYLGRYGKK